MLNILAKKIASHKEILMAPSDDFDLVIYNGLFSLYENGKVVNTIHFEVKDLIQQINALPYVKVLSVSNDVMYSPLEADRFVKLWVEEENTKNLNFPKFLPIFFLYVYYTSKLPDFKTFVQLYMKIYMELVPENLINRNLQEFYTEPYPFYLKLGEEIKCNNGFTFINKAIRYKQEYIENLHIAINQLTMEQLVVRMSKVYGSIIRDFYNPFLFNHYGADTYYSYYADLNGVDMVLNDIPCYSYTNTKAAMKFAQDKQTKKHKIRTDCGIRMKVNVPSFTKKDSIRVMPDNIAKNIIVKALPENGFVDIIY